MSTLPSATHRPSGLLPGSHPPLGQLCPAPAHTWPQGQHLLPLDTAIGVRCLQLTPKSPPPSRPGQQLSLLSILWSELGPDLMGQSQGVLGCSPLWRPGELCLCSPHYGRSWGPSGQRPCSLGCWWGLPNFEDPGLTAAAACDLCPPPVPPVSQERHSHKGLLGIHWALGSWGHRLPISCPQP